MGENLRKSAGVVITRYRESDEEVIAFIKELAKQKNIFLKVLLFDQIKSNLIRDYLKKSKIKNIRFDYFTIKEKSLGEIRDMGIKKSRENLIIFTDLDMYLDKNWANRLIRGFSDNVSICGGRIEINYLNKPRWYHNSIVIRSIYGYLDLSNHGMFVKKVNGGNIAINKKILGKDAFFRRDLGRKKGKLFGGEETELCKRAIEKGLKIRYIPNAVVYHKIDKRRMSIKNILLSMFYQGKNKVIMGSHIGPTNKSKYQIKDWIVIPFIIPAYLLGIISQKGV